MTWHTGMTASQMIEAAEHQRVYDLAQARMWRDHYQGIVDKLEARDLINRESGRSK